MAKKTKQPQTKALANKSKVSKSDSKNKSKRQQQKFAYNSLREKMDDDLMQLVQGNTVANPKTAKLLGLNKKQSQQKSQQDEKETRNPSLSKKSESSVNEELLKQIQSMDTK